MSIRFACSSEQRAKAGIQLGCNSRWRREERVAIELTYDRTRFSSFEPRQRPGARARDYNVSKTSMSEPNASGKALRFGHSVTNETCGTACVPYWMNFNAEKSQDLHARREGSNRRVRHILLDCSSVLFLRGALIRHRCVERNNRNRLN
jgi:hypothetical protein